MRKITLLALLLILCVSGAAVAQETPPVFCGTLSQADCAILTQSQAAMKSLDSASFNLDINVTVSDIPQMTEPLSIGVTGSGAYSGIGAMTSAILDNPGDMSKMLTGLLTKLNFDGTVTINLSPDIVKMARIPASITIQERLVDGIGYLNLDTLSALMGRSQLHGWYGLDLAGLLDAAMKQMPDMFNGSMGNMSAMQDYQKAMMNPDFYNRFMTIERTDDGSGDTAMFAMTINMASLMTSPEFTALMNEQMQAQGTTMTDAERGQAMAMVSQMFKGMSITIHQEIGLSDYFVHNASGSFSFDTTGMMKSMSTMSKSTPSAQASPKISVDFSYSYSDFNAAPAITAPEGATIIPYQSLLTRSVSA